METATSLAIAQLSQYLRALTGRLDPGAGWYGEFLRRDPAGMRACLDGTAMPPWDVVESLLGDAGADAREAEYAAGLRAAAVRAWDARPGGAQELRTLLAAAVAERAASEAALRDLTARLAAAPGPPEAESLGRELAWTQDDAARAAARCEDLTHRLTEAPLRAPGAPVRAPDPLDPAGGAERLASAEGAGSPRLAVGDLVSPEWVPGRPDPAGSAPTPGHLDPVGGAGRLGGAVGEPAGPPTPGEPDPVGPAWAPGGPDSADGAGRLASAEGVGRPGLAVGDPAGPVWALRHPGPGRERGDGAQPADGVDAARPEVAQAGDGMPPRRVGEDVPPPPVGDGVAAPVGRAEGRWLRGGRRAGGARYAGAAVPPPVFTP
ncbi:hypothetical protein ACFXO4_32780, partial [Streptomyces goshikiensis]